MTDFTSPVATLAGRLPKGNGLTRAVPKLFDQRGALVPFVGLMRVQETGLDAEDVQHLKGSIARFELCLGSLDREGKALLAAATTAANEYSNGQQSLFPADTSEEDAETQRHRLLGFLREWQAEQTPEVDDEAAAEKWNSWHGGFYDARPEAAAPVHLREFLMHIGALADSESDKTDEPEPAEGEPGEDDLEAELDSPAPAPAPSNVVPFQHGGTDT